MYRIKIERTEYFALTYIYDFPSRLKTTCEPIESRRLLLSYLLFINNASSFLIPPSPPSRCSSSPFSAWPQPPHQPWPHQLSRSAPSARPTSPSTPLPTLPTRQTASVPSVGVCHPFFFLLKSEHTTNQQTTKQWAPSRPLAPP